MIVLIWWGVMICNPLYVLVAYVWDIVELVLFLRAYTELYIWDSLFVVPLVVIVPSGGGWVHIIFCTLFGL